MKNNEIFNGGLTTQSEARIQQECVTWYRNNYCLKHHNPRCMILSIPNEGLFQTASMELPKSLLKRFLRFLRLMLFKLIATGLYPGCADLLVLHDDGGDNDLPHARPPVMAFIEVKTPDACSGPRKNGQSQKQIDFEYHCIAMNIPYHIVRSLEEFRWVIENL